MEVRVPGEFVVYQLKGPCPACLSGVDYDIYIMAYLSGMGCGRKVDCLSGEGPMGPWTHGPMGSWAHAPLGPHGPFIFGPTAHGPLIWAQAIHLGVPGPHYPAVWLALLSPGVDEWWWW